MSNEICRLALKIVVFTKTVKVNFINRFCNASISCVHMCPRLLPRKPQISPSESDARQSQGYRRVQLHSRFSPSHLNFFFFFFSFFNFFFLEVVLFYIIINTLLFLLYAKLHLEKEKKIFIALLSISF